MPERRKKLADRRGHFTQKVKIGGTRGPQCRTLYLSTDDETTPSELFLRVKQHNISSEVVGLYDTIARLVSLALQYNVPVEAIGKKLLRTRMLPAGPVVGDARIKSCESTLDYVGRKLLVDCCGRDDLAQVPKYPEASP